MATDHLWQAVRTRDRKADGAFVYAVKTTKIYCRPSCPARLARQSNVVFFDNGLEAQSSGFRACKRCRPELSTFAPDEQMVRNVQRAIERFPSSNPVPSLQTLAGAAGLTEHHFHRRFRRATGVTPRAFAIRCRQNLQSPVDNETQPTTIGKNAGGLQQRRGCIATPGTIPGSSTSSPSLCVMPQMYGPTPPPWDTGLDCNSYDLPISDSQRSQACTQEGIQCDENVYYQIIESGVGSILIVVIAAHICMLELGTSAYELIESVTNAFPESRYSLHKVDQFSDGRGYPMQSLVPTIVEAIERPSGKMIHLPFSSPLRARYLKG